jgi:hypothetical protein
MKRVRSGAVHSTALYLYRGVEMIGRPPRHGWGSASWTWSANVAGETLRASTRRELAERIDRRLAA